MSFDDPFVYLPFLGWIIGLTTMVFLHNFVVSAFLYKSRQTNTSNVLKICFNFGGLLFFIGEVWALLVPRDVSLVECKAMAYIKLIGQITLNSSLAAFLLWRLRQIESNKMDYWISIGLFVIRFSFQFSGLFIVKPTRAYYAAEDAYFCVPGYNAAASVLTTALSLDILIDSYVTFRLVQILTKANKNVTQISSNITRKTKRTLFTAVMYWNFVRLGLAICEAVVNLYYVVLGFQSEISTDLQITSKSLQVVFIILLSYAITADAEIVRVIEGKKANLKGSSNISAGTGKLTKNSDREKEKNMLQSAKSTLISSDYRESSSSEPPKYSEGNYSYSGNEKQQESSNIGEDKVAVVSMKRLSFFEWANVVVGNKLNKKNKDNNNDNNNDIVDVEKGVEIEEIVDEVADNKFDHDSSSNNRDSSFSGTTTMTTTSSIIDEDIV